MPLIAIIAFVICVVLFVLLSTVLANRKKLKSAFEYGKKNFDIELPQNVQANKAAFNKLSDAAAFFILVTPYAQNLSSDKQKRLQSEIKKLKADLKISNDVYDRFMAGFNKKDAA